LGITQSNIKIINQKKENQKFTQKFGEISQEYAKKMNEGSLASDESVQALVKQHFEFSLQFCTTTKETCKSLTMGYILSSPYKDAYEEVAVGLGKYHYDAICI